MTTTLIPDVLRGELELVVPLRCRHGVPLANVMAARFGKAVPAVRRLSVCLVNPLIAQNTGNVGESWLRSPARRAVCLTPARTVVIPRCQAEPALLLVLVYT